MIQTFLLVLGPLAGATVAGLMQHLTTTRTARATAAEHLWQADRDAIDALLGAVGMDRNHQYRKIARRRERQPDTEETRAARYNARTAVNNAYGALALSVRSSDLITAATEARDAAVALGNVNVRSDHIPEDEIASAGRRARNAHTALLEAGIRHLYG